MSYPKQEESRTRFVTLRMIPPEHDAASELASRRGMTLADHVRDLIVRASKGEFKIDTPTQKPLF